MAEDTMTDALPFGWRRNPNGDIWDSPGIKAKPVAYVSEGKWMVAGQRTVEELRAIVEVVSNG